MIKAGKIKESIFCYWSLLNEKYIKENKREKNNELKNTVITQKTSGQENNCSIILTIDSDVNYYTEINLVELRKFATESNSEERWVDYFNIKNEDILFIGRKRS